MATYAEIYARSQDANITAQIAVAITKDAQYALQNATDPVLLNWATYVVPVAYQEARNWQLMICKDPAIADAVEVTDENVQASVTALVTTMAKAYGNAHPAPTGGVS
jgi:hypothetical protein